MALQLEQGLFFKHTRASVPQPATFITVRNRASIIRGRTLKHNMSISETPLTISPRPICQKKQVGTRFANGFRMIKQYFTSSLRSLWTNRRHTTINLLGLTLGITCTILIFQVITFELSFDQYHKNTDRIYRVVTQYLNSDNAFNSGTTYPLPPALKNDFPDPEHVILVDANLGDIVLSVAQPDGTSKKFKEDRICFADHGYFQMLDHEWIEGGPDALNREKTVTISESIAKKYFNNEPALNKIINFNNQFDVTVAGVFKDVPLNSSIQFPIVLSNKLGADQRGWESWGSTSSGLNCFVMLQEGVTKEAFEKKLEGWHFKYFTGEDEEDGKNLRYFLQPLSEMHYDTRYTVYYGPIRSYTTLLTLGSIGVLLLLTACVNFINLNTVLIGSRSKEVGIRKTLGSNRSSIAMQFVAETFFVTLLAVCISIALVEIALSLLTPVLGYTLNFHPFTDIQMLLFLLSLPIVVALLAGLYPALRLSGFQPVHALKNKFLGNESGAINLRRALIVFQLVVSQALIVATIIIVQQMQHFSNMPLGIAKDTVVEFDVPEQDPKVLRELHARLRSIPGVEGATLSNTGSVSNNTWNSSFEAKISGSLIKETAQVKFADASFVHTYGLQILVGNDLKPSDTADGFLVNEEFVQLLGLSNAEAIGFPIKIWGFTGDIRGVIKNFHTRSLHEEMDPVIILSNTRYYQNGAVRLRTKDSKEALAEVQKVWEDVFPKYVFEYEFLGQIVADFYSTERNDTYLIGLFAIVAILVACIGLYGLISYMAHNRVKEIGIRKTLGASVTQIMTLLSKEFVILTVLAFVISAPAVYYMAETWLSNFAYRIHPDISTFLLSILLIFAIVLSTIGTRSYTAATANPVDALRNE